jgi:Tfp pilus assembly protein PilO
MLNMWLMIFVTCIFAGIYFWLLKDMREKKIQRNARRQLRRQRQRREGREIVLTYVRQQLNDLRENERSILNELALLQYLAENEVREKVDWKNEGF